MTLNDYRCFLILLALGSILFGINTVFSFEPRIDSIKGISYTELWILDQNKAISNYPFNIGIDENKTIFVGIRNNEGRSMFYVLHTIIVNQTQSNSTSTSPSSTSSLERSYIFLENKESWESRMSIVFIEASDLNDICNLETVLLNGSLIETNIYSSWDSSRNGYFYQMKFDLWMYDTTLEEFNYHNRSVSIWLNVTI